MKLSARQYARIIALIACLCVVNTTFAADDENSNSVLTDIKLYFTSPLRWDRDDWLMFGGSIAVVGIAHHYDDDARIHFYKVNPSLATDTNSYELKDYIPTVVALLGTLSFASITNDNDGMHEARSMVEATGLSLATGYALKFAAGRKRPNETADSNAWRKSGDSFPSSHSAAAFAVGTVLAESGNEEYRWVRRALGYGLGAYTSYERVKHNQHWLSDTVAGSVLGWASARFVLNRDTESHRRAQFSVLPLDNGVMISFAYQLQ